MTPIDSRRGLFLLRVGAGVLLALHLAFSVAPAFSSYRNDFLNYYLPARACLQGRPLDRAYERLWMAAEAERAGIPFVGLFMPNPPPNALLLVPLAGLGPAAAKAAWTALLLAALAGAFLVLRRALAIDTGLLALAFLVPSTALATALGYGPPYALLLLLCALAFASAQRGHEWACGLLLAPVAALKLYALALLPYFLWTRRWRAAAGLVLGLLALGAFSVAVLGLPVHLTYLREMLPASLDGRIIDPYSPYWQTLAAVSRRLFQFEPELNPAAVADIPRLASFLSRAAAALLLVPVLASARTADGPEQQRRQWAALLVASLATSPMTASYHLVLLVLPCALLLCDAAPRRAAAVLALLAFAASPLPHRFTPLAHGWLNLLAAPRLLALLALWALAMAPLLNRRALARSGAAALAAGLAAAAGPVSPPPPGQRIEAARGLLLAQPVECGGTVAWVSSPDRTRYSVLSAQGTVATGDAVRCRDGELLVERAVEALGPGPMSEDQDRVGAQPVDFDGQADARRPRLSRDGRWVVYQAWSGQSWDVRAFEVASGRVVNVAATADHEIEPSWSEDGTRVLFASGYRRGLFGYALYEAPFRP